MTDDEVRKRLLDAGIGISSEGRLKNNTGVQLRLTNDAIVNVFDTGKVSVQGQNTEEVQVALGMGNGGALAPAAVALPAAHASVKKRVFVVYGHDQDSRNALEAMLRRWGLEPLILDQLPTEGQTVIEKLETAMKEADFGVVLATPDDEGHRAGHTDEKAFRARQNVVLEMGMLLARLGRENVAVLLKTQERMEKPSDITGLIYIPFTDDIAKDAGVLLAKAMDARGYKIDIARL